MNTIDIETEAQRIDAALHPAPLYRHTAFRRALLLMLFVPALVYVLTFILAVIPSIGLRGIGISKFGPVLDYGFEARHVDADVLIFGDSSAFLGIDPRIVHADLGTVTAVIPNTIGSLPATGDLPLRRYLAQNKPPRLLVLYFSGWNMDYAGQVNSEFLFEGEEELLRYGSFHDILRYSVHHPLQILSFPFQAYRLLGIRNVITALRHPDSERKAALAQAFGHLDYTLPYGQLLVPCHLRPQQAKAAQDGSVRDLLRRYSAHMRVVVYVAPLPNCDNARQASHPYANLQAAPAAVEPVSWFADDSFFAHVRPEHVAENSHLFSSAIRPALAAAH